MEEVIKKVSKIVEILSDISIDSQLTVPRLAVVGQQSSGKSSVLEGIIGLDILPRSAGLCTRVPLILSILNNNSISENIKPEFSHLSPDQNNAIVGNSKDTTAKNIQNEILRRTNELTKPNELKNTPINLSISSKGFPNLTVVDLPGLTKISTTGQSTSVVAEIESMVRTFISQKSTIILAVVPANSDLANSDALSIAQEYDPKGDRTLGILTKLDLMDEGTSAINIINNEEFFLKLGYIPVVSRSQLDLEKEISVEVSRSKEESFFMLHADYCNISERCGFSFLKDRLGEVFQGHVYDSLPILRREVSSKRTALEKQLKDLGGSVTNPTEQIYMVLSEVFSGFQAAIKGKLAKDKNAFLFGGSFLKEIMTKSLSKDLKKITSDISEETDLSSVSLNSLGIESNIIFNDAAFKICAQKEIETHYQVLAKNSEMVTVEVNRLLEYAINDSSAARFPNLKLKIIKLTYHCLQDFSNKVNERIRSMIDLEAGHINTEHPDFFELPMKIFNEEHLKVSSKLNFHERARVLQERVSLRLIVDYIKIVNETLQSLIQKLYLKEMVIPMEEFLKHQLLVKIIREEDLDKLVEENARIAEKKKELKENLKKFESVDNIIQTIRL